ncbi:MAG: sulfotransferase domain-containing protein [Wenzhouxiangella sp.]
MAQYVFLGVLLMVVSHDRLKHWAIVYSTAWLPRRARVASRYELMARQRRAMLRRGDVVMVRHPKTGSTWLRALLTQLYHRRDGISPKRVFAADELALQKKGLPRWVISNAWYSLEKLIAEAYRSNDPLIQGKKTILLARHPGDIVVSWHRQYQKRTKASKRELIEADVCRDADIDWRTLDRWSFIQREELGLPAIIRYYNFWAETLAERDDALIVRYEDLRADTKATLYRVTDLLGEQFDDRHYDEAIEFCSVANMRKLERSGYFQNNSLRLRDASDPDALKVRRARVGGFRNDLSPEQAAWIEDQVTRHCHPALGYGKQSA